MKVGFVGLGKLGLPCAVAIDMHGHDVIGYDIQESLMSKSPRPYRETGPDGIEPFNPYLEKSNLRFGNLQEVADFSDIIFLAVQTPHEEKFEGVTRIPDERIDFNYAYLKESVASLSKVITRDTTVVIISTVLPGTIRNEILPLANDHMKICYNPFFIAMGTTMRDFLNPEFILFGVHDEKAAEQAEFFYKTLTNSRFYKTTVENAELIKVSYNTFIGMKIVFANTLMEICHKTLGTDVTEVTEALKLADRRLISTHYMDAGMGDGGGCHPRDNIAMSWLARKLDLSYDFFDSLMIARERQTDWLADLIMNEMNLHELPLVILGKSFKKETNITVGSPAVLLANILKEKNVEFDQYDPYVDQHELAMKKAIYFVATDHDEFDQISYPAGSVIIDPWGHVKPKPGVDLVSVGRQEMKMLEKTSIEILEMAS